VSKTQRRIGCYAALAVNNACNAVHRHFDLAREFGSRDSNLAQFFGKMFTGMDGGAGQDGFLSMIIDDLDVYRAGRSFRPPKADPPLIVDADRKLSGAVAFERFQPVTRQSRQIGKTCHRFEPVKTYLSLPCKARELLDMSSGGKPLGGFVPIADNHDDDRVTGVTNYVNSNSTTALAASRPFNTI
jgi:hypothetical protein